MKATHSSQSLTPHPNFVIVESRIRLPATELVFGDIVTITLGSKVPADLRLVEVSSDLRFDRSILTGESNAIPGTVECTDPNCTLLLPSTAQPLVTFCCFQSVMESRNIALQGTLCTSGSGIGVCVGLGDGTVFGRIAKQATSERPARTTLEVEILRFVIIIASLAVGIAILIVSES